MGDGTEESHAKVQGSLQAVWYLTGEMFEGDEVDQIIQDEFHGPKLDQVKVQWQASVSDLLAEAVLAMPADRRMENGARKGRHTEHFGPLIKEMQCLQRRYPGLTW